MKKFNITLDVFLMDHITVEAKNKKQAIKEAIQRSQYNDGAAEFRVFEIEEVTG